MLEQLKQVNPLAETIKQQTCVNMLLLSHDQGMKNDLSTNAPNNCSNTACAKKFERLTIKVLR